MRKRISVPFTYVMLWRFSSPPSLPMCIRLPPPPRLPTTSADHHLLSSNLLQKLQALPNSIKSLKLEHSALESPYGLFAENIRFHGTKFSGIFCPNLKVTTDFFTRKLQIYLSQGLNRALTSDFLELPPESGKPRSQPWKMKSPWSARNNPALPSHPLPLHTLLF